MYKQTLAALAKALRQKKISSVELTQYYLQRIEQYKSLNACTEVDAEYALELAAKADTLLHKGDAPILTGIPMGIKDLLCTKRLKTTCGSKMLANYQAPFDATLVSLLQEQGAILLAKNNMDEFAMGSANDTSYLGLTRNPWDENRTPGGSSGGSAAAVAAGQVPFSIASDTGGSIRQPAAFCGICGIKPTYGLVSRFGMVAYASSLDQAGPMAHSAEDLGLILQIIQGHDPKDSTSITAPKVDYAKAMREPLDGMRIGLPSCFFQPEVEPGIQKAILEAVEVLKGLGVEIIPLELNNQSLWIACYYVIAFAEASSNLSRFDGIRYGHRGSKQETVQALIKSSRSEGFGAEVQRRILMGTHLLSAEHFDAEYLQAQKIRRIIQQELLNKLLSVDAILGPTTPTCAFKLNERPQNPIQRYLGDIFTVAANLAGLPALSMPVGFDKHLPVGVQLMGSHFSEGRLLKLAYHYQQHTDWHLAKPPL